MRDALDRIAKGFGPEAKYTKIIIDDGTPRIIAQDPLKPTETADFHLNPEDIERWSATFDPTFREEDAFTLEEAQELNAARIGVMMDETSRQMKLPNGIVSRITLSRGNVFVKSRRNLITDEVRVETPNGSGGVTFEPDGAVIDVVTP